MTLMKKSALYLAAAVASLALAQSALFAHDMITEGTVLTVAATKLEITTPNKSTKKNETVAFVVDKNTKVKRGDKILSYANAKIQKGEKITVVVDTDAKPKMLATEMWVQAR